MIETIFGILNNERGIELLESYEAARPGKAIRVTIDALAYFADEQQPGEYEQQANEAAEVTAWLQAESAAALYMEGTEPSPFIWGGEVYDPSECRPATEPDNDMPF